MVMKKITLCLLFIFSFNSYAILNFEDYAFPELVTYSRALGMGNAYMNKVDDPWAAFYNPAGLGTVRNFQMHLLNVHTEVNDGFLDITAGQGSYTDAVTNYADALTPSGVRNLLANNPGNLSHTRFQIFPNMTFRGFQVGYIYSQQNRARLNSLADDLELAERKDSGPMAALSISLWGGVIKVGASVVLLTREEFQKDFAGNAPINIDKNVDYRKGTMTYVVSGARLTLPIFLLPTFSYVMRNATGAVWSNPTLGGAPAELPTTHDAAFSIAPILGRNIRVHIEATAKDLTNQYATVPANRKIGFGMEFDFYRKMFVRFGYGDGWGSAGIGVRNRMFMFELTTYGVEISPDGSRQEEDRRTILSISQGV
jgi:hypothetical protein